MLRKKSQNIEALRKKFHREWLLIAVDKMDPATSIPLTGRLLFHSHHRDEVYTQSGNYRKSALLVYSEDGFPKGYAAAFLYA